jgi:asparagine synthase (glutamine-hydrolysing)
VCGILGSIGYIPPDHAVEKANGHLLHRGPDASGVWADKRQNVFLFHRRLAILDLSDDGNQPMRHPTNPSIVIVFNGEIYNYYSLRKEIESKNVIVRSKSDTELLLHAYALWGVEMLYQIKGMFAFAIWDGDKKTLFVARDPVGQKPLFYSVNGNKFCFSSTPKALRDISQRVGGLDYESLCFAVTLGYVPSPNAIWENMQCLDAGHFLLWEEGKLSTPHAYWKPLNPYEKRTSDSDEFIALLSEVLGEHFLSDVPVGLLLSGGLDSSLLAALATEIGRKDVSTFTLDFANNPNSEASIAAGTARHLGLDHMTAEFSRDNIDKLRQLVSVSSYQPQGYSAMLTWYQLSERVARNFKTVLSADGGDELFAGYRWYGHQRFSLSQAKRLISAGLKSSRLEWELNQFSRKSPLHAHVINVFPRFLPDEAATLFAPLGHGFCDEAMLEPLHRFWDKELSLQDSLQRIDLMTFCSGSICAKTDNMSMAHSLEVRAPLLDVRIIDWAFSRRVPQFSGRQGKPLIRQALRGKVPKNVMSHPKQGFSMRTEGYDYEKLLDEVDNSIMSRSGMLNPQWKMLLQKRTPYRNARIWTLASLTKWYEYNL